MEDEGWWSDPKIFLCIPASAAGAATVNPNRIKTLSAKILITFFMSGNPVFSNGWFLEVYQEILLIVSS